MSSLAALGSPDAVRMRSARTGALAFAVVDAVAFTALHAAGIRLEFAQGAAYAAGILATFLLLGRALPLSRPLQALIVALAFPLHAGVLSLAAAHLPPLGAIIPAALAGALALGLGLGFARDRDEPTDTGTTTLLGVAFLLAIRVVYLGQLDLVPQEAYYWNYSQHLDIGYLDHPPLVAWLIAGSLVLGGGEFFVRLPALLCWLVMAAYAFAFARDLAGPAEARRALLLAATLPFFFVVGWMITPDAPLAAAWAAALYYLHRALLLDRPRAWIGAGAAIGVGMLAKYTMVLVPLAAVVFVLVDARARRVLLTPWPWIGAVLALVIFSPVIAWNVRHDWASFAFQGSRRLAGQGSQFSLHEFAGFVVVLLTPPGLLALWRLWRPREPAAGAAAAATGPFDAAALPSRQRLFVLAFTLVPLAVLAAASVKAETKIHWTGPVWLAVLPVLAATFTRPSRAGGRLDEWLARSWVPMLHALMLVYAYGLFYYPVWGLAGVRAHHHYVEMGWRDLRAQVQVLEDEVERETGRRPAVVGLDKHNTADEMAFYDPRGDGAKDTASRHLFFDENALMYEFWFPREVFAGRDLVVVARRRDAVEDPRLAAASARLGPVRALTARKGGVAVGTYYARVVYGYRPPPPEAR